MLKKIKKLRWVGLFLILFSGILLISSRLSSTNLKSYRPLIDQKIDLTTGSRFEEIFITETTGRYFINLSFKKTDDLSKLECQLGIQNFNSAACDLGKNSFDVSWYIISKENEIASGSTLKNTMASYLSDAVVRELGWFDASEGNEYTIGVLVNQFPPALAHLDPKLSVEIAPTSYKDEMTLAMFSAELALVILCVGTLISLISFSKSTWYRKDSFDHHYE